MQFAELAAKTNHSFLEGASFPEEMVAQARFLGYHSLGIVDKHGVYGLPRAFAAARETGLRLLYGAEICLPNAQAIYLLARDRDGYGNLCELLTAAHDHGHNDPVYQLETLLERSPGLFALVPALGADETVLPPLKHVFGERLYLLASRFHDGKDPLFVEAAESLSRDFDLPVVASNQPLFHSPRRKPLQDAITCIRHTCPLREAGFRLLPNQERHLKSPAAISALFPRHPEWLANTVRIAEACRFRLDEIRYHYPREWIPPGETGDSYLEKLVREGAHERYGGEIPLAVEEQLRHELTLIRELEYSDYFLTVWDIVQFAKREGILCQGRGAAANSLVCYVLGITAVDPVRMSLLFERFISRERREPPDIDIDFEHERREEVIQYIYRRYGRDRAAITAEVISYRRRSAMREVAKVLEIPPSTVERFLTLSFRREMKEIPAEEWRTIADEEKIPVRKLRQFLALVLDLQGFPRHLGTHVGGFVLCHEPLTRLVPVEKAAMPDRSIVQWDKDDLDTLGFVRVDILGLGILTAIRKSFEYLRPRGIFLELGRIPDEPEVYEMFCRADTVGVFQIESRAQMNMLPRLRPRMFYDIVVEVSLVRPGPIQGDMVHPYLRRRSGKEKVEYLHPKLEKILGKTFGVPLFQEQIMKMAMEVAGFSAGEADELRRAMGSWRRRGHNRLTRMGDKFRRGLEASGIPKAFAEKVFHQIEGFAEYGFPESHAASFALLAYVTGYLKLHYPAVFLTALLNSQPMGFYRNHTLLHDGERHGVKCLPIDIQSSRWDNQVTPADEIRLGYREIKGFPRRTGLALERARQAGPFLDLPDLTMRLQASLLPDTLTKRELFLLAGANALERLGLTRRDALWEIQALPLQDSLFFSPSEGKAALPEEADWERITADYEAQGLSLFAHPMAFLREECLAHGVQTSAGLLRLPVRRRARVAGMVICRQMPPTASGVLFITLEDEHGFSNLVIWKNVYERYRECLITQSFLLCEGRVEKAEDGEVTHLIVEKAEPLLTSTAPAAPPSHDWG